MIPPIASNFVAGETPETALAHVEELNENGVAAIVNLLGEHYEERAPADADANEYVELADLIAERGADACISVKPSQIGLEVGATAFEENLARIVDAADCFVWVDMEDHETTDVTLDAVERHTVETDGQVGVCVQANLKRTREDLERLADLPGKVRLVKGAYDEPAEIAYKKKARVDESYRDLLEFMFREFDDGVAVGSHDPAMIDLARDLHEEYGTAYEVQMLMGVRETEQYALADEVDVYQYIPYGSKWFSYFYRRVREQKSNALFALRAVVGR
ncbi:proline dehydrogenase family protein [Halosimplex salinum]|uniref:proline dehydrogenase family protein n=1 Tax=Halosimplex salinum TaxID=1710538 RepID=UPI000F46D902|nr:proline dehydrogenase family protein [Halosimplex salinum]